MEIGKYMNIMFWCILISTVVWYSYTWAVIGWMVAKFQESIASTSTIQAIVKIITCVVICIVYFWMFYLVLVLRSRYKGISQLYQVNKNVTTTKVVKTIIRVT